MDRGCQATHRYSLYITCRHRQSVSVDPGSRTDRNYFKGNRII